jgi:N-acetylglutamate synthase
VKGAYVVRITPSDVGRRVSVRSRLPDPEPGGPTTTDTLGHLRAWSEGALAIERRDGSLAHVREADLLAGRVIPEAPERRRTR